ncbi:hypothetical protein [Microcoleus sp. CAWBG640]|uniref:hypothetical protein n=1 Tax=Microcoleus sp. CAWBG640 TaxID=2841653 RepID=UPI00312BB159
MHKLLYFATIGLLAFSIGGCGDGGGGNTASPSPTPGGASPSPSAAASPTPGTQTFPSPVVAAQPPGLIRSTNPDQRAQQSATGIGDNKSQPKNPPAPGQPIPSGALTPNPAQIDPFGPLPPIAVQNPAGAESVGVAAGPMTANPLPKLVSRKIDLLPKLPELTRPVQIGGTKLKGPAAPPINLSPIARGVVNEFRTLQALLDDTTKYSEYGTDLSRLVRTIYGKEGEQSSTRRELLLTNRPFFRRIEKALGEYETASNLWNIYGDKSPPDALRCSIVPQIAEAIEVYRPPTERRGSLSCVTRINLLQAVWRQGKNRLDAAVRDQDYEARTIAKAPLLPVLSETPTNPQPAGEKALGRDLAAVPQIPRLRSPQNPTLPGGEGAQLGSPRQVPGVDAPQLASRSEQGGLPGGDGAQVGSPRQVPGLNAPPFGGRPGQPGLPGGDGSQVGSPRQVPGLNAPPFGGRPGQPGLPGGDGSQVGSPRQVPGITTPPFGRRPNPATTADRNPLTARNPRPPQPIAAKPLGVPNLPPLPVDKRPPQWVDPNPPPVKQVPAIPGPPPPPSTDLATGTEVSGVVKVGSETQVIVRVPNEPTSRYVKVGQRLSNGRVLVKRVDVKSGADPIVILEENGVEVAKGVGEKAPSREPKPANAVISRLPNANRATGR